MDGSESARTCSQNIRRVGFADASESNIISAMPRKQGRVHVVRVHKTHVDKQGQRRHYTSAYLRRTYRDGPAVRNETVANLSMLPPEALDAIEATLKGQALVPAGSEFTIVRSLPHGHVAAVAAMARQLGLPALLGPAGRSRDIVLALVISRIDAAEVEAVHAGLVARHHVGHRPGRGRRVDRRDLRRDGLAGRPPRRDRAPARGQTPWPRGESAPDGVVRPDQRVGDRPALRAGRARLLPRRQERLRADRIRGAHRPRRPPGRGARVHRQHRRPGCVHQDRHRHPRHAGHRQVGARRRSRHDHLRAHRRAT